MSYPTLSAHAAKNAVAREVARELRLRAIIAKTNAVIAKPKCPVAELEFMQALRAEFDDGVGFDARWEDACSEAGWNDDAGDYTANLTAADEFDRSRRIDLLSAWGR